MEKSNGSNNKLIILISIGVVIILISTAYTLIIQKIEGEAVINEQMGRSIKSAVNESRQEVDAMKARLDDVEKNNKALQEEISELQDILKSLTAPTKAQLRAAERHLRIQEGLKGYYSDYTSAWAGVEREMQMEGK